MVVGEASIHNIMGGMESTGGVRLHNHKRKLKQRFDIIKKLGQGTYGKVQLGINKETGQEVAIKTIKKCKIETEADLIRIRREIQIMSSVQHPNIIHIYEVFENKEKIVLVMEYAAGGELYDYLSERKVLSEEEARRIFRQISIAVFYCHKHKICHRDLKLENILLDQIGNAKIADFGLSNVFDDQRLLNTFCGSPLYASPEIVKGTPYHGPEVDCWSLGVLLYTLVYGAMPFDGSNFKRLTKQISQSDYFEPKNPSPASPLIKDMLTNRPSKRSDIEKICSHWWVNEGHDQNCLDIAEDLAAQTPVRLDLLLSLVPQSASADKLVVGDERTTGENVNNVSSETLAPTRCHSVGSLMELDRNNSDRRIREMVEEEPRPSATGGDAKRKLENTPSMEETAGLEAGAKRKERLRKKDKNDETRPHRFTSNRHHSAPISHPITEEAMEVDPGLIENVSTKPLLDLRNDETATACLELIKESLSKSPSKERSKTPVASPDQESAISRESIRDPNENVAEMKPMSNKLAGVQEKSSEPTRIEIPEDSTKQARNGNETTGKKAAETEEKILNSVSEVPNRKVVEEPEKLANEQVPTSRNDESTVETLNPKDVKKLKQKSLSLDTDVSNEAAVPPGKTSERRRSKIFETAEKFNQLAAGIENDKPKKIFIPGVNVGGAKRAFERKASLSSIVVPQTVKQSASKVIIDVPNNERKNEALEEKSNNAMKTGQEIRDDDLKREEEKKRAVDIITGAIGKPPVQKKINGSPPITPQSPESKKLGLKIQVGPNDLRSATVSVSTPVDTKFPFETKATPYEISVPNSPESQSFDSSYTDEPTMSSKMEITLKSATLPRQRKTSKAEITLSGIKSPEVGAFKSEVEAKIDAFHPQKLRTQRSEVAFPVAAVVPHPNRSSSLEPEGASRMAPKERIIPIQVETDHQQHRQTSTPPPKPPMPQRSMSQRSGSLSRQSTADSDTDSALGSTVGPEPIRKSPREYIIPIAVEGGGYVTPRSGSVEPESKTSTPTSTNPPRSRFGRPRRMSSLLSDASEDESPFSTLHRDSDDLLQRHMHRLRSSRPTRQAPEHADSLSSGEDDDDDGFELLTAENLFSTLLSRVRSLTQRLNVDDNRGSGFPSSRLLGRLGSNSSQGFWGLHEPLSRRIPESPFRRSMGRDADRFGKRDSAVPSNSGTASTRSTPSRESIFEMGSSNTLPRDRKPRQETEAIDDADKLIKSTKDTLEQNFTPSLARRLSRQFIEQTRQSLPRSPSIPREKLCGSSTDEKSEAGEIRPRSSTISDQTDYRSRSCDRGVRRTNSFLERNERFDPRSPRRSVSLFDDDEEQEEEEEEEEEDSSLTTGSLPRQSMKFGRKYRDPVKSSFSNFHNYRTEKIQEEPHDEFSCVQRNESWKNQAEASREGSTTNNSNVNLADTGSSLSVRSWETSPTESSSTMGDCPPSSYKQNSARDFESRLMAAENLIKESKARNLGGSKYEGNLGSSYRDDDNGVEKELLSSMSEVFGNYAKRRSCIPSLRLRSGSLTREASIPERRNTVSCIKETTPSERSLLGKFFRAGSSSGSSKSEQEAKEKSPKAKGPRRISRFLRPDFFDTPREESRYVKEKEALKAAENERRKSRFTRKKNEVGKTAASQEEEEKQAEGEVKPEKELKNEANAMTRDKADVAPKDNKLENESSNSRASETKPDKQAGKNSFFQSLEKKLEKFRSGDDSSKMQNGNVPTGNEKERELRENSAPPIETTREALEYSKRPVSVENLNLDEPSTSTTKSRVSSVLGLFKNDSSKANSNGQRPQNTILSKFKRNPYKGSRSDGVLSVDQTPSTSSSGSSSSSKIPTKFAKLDGKSKKLSEGKKSVEKIAEPKRSPEKTVELKKSGEKLVELKKSAEKLVELKKSPEKLVDLKKSGEKLVELKKSAEKLVELKKSGEKTVELKKSAEKLVELKKSGEKLVEMKKSVSKEKTPPERIVSRKSAEKQTVISKKPSPEKCLEGKQDKPEKAVSSKDDLPRENGSPEKPDNKTSAVRLSSRKLLGEKLSDNRQIEAKVSSDSEDKKMMVKVKKSVRSLSGLVNNGSVTKLETRDKTEEVEKRTKRMAKPKESSEKDSSEGGKKKKVARVVKKIGKNSDSSDSKSEEKESTKKSLMKKITGGTKKDTSPENAGKNKEKSPETTVKRIKDKCCDVGVKKAKEKSPESKVEEKSAEKICKTEDPSQGTIFLDAKSPDSISSGILPDDLLAAASQSSSGTPPTIDQQPSKEISELSSDSKTPKQTESKSNSVPSDIQSLDPERKSSLPGLGASKSNKVNLKLDLTKIPQHSFKIGTIPKKESTKPEVSVGRSTGNCAKIVTAAESPKSDEPESRLTEKVSKTTRRTDAPGDHGSIGEPLRSVEDIRREKSGPEIPKSVESPAGFPQDLEKKTEPKETQEEPKDPIVHQENPPRPTSLPLESKTPESPHPSRGTPNDPSEDIFSPVDDPESFDSWSICSADMNHHRQDLNSPTSPTYSPMTRGDHPESIIDRIRRKSFYSRFNERKRKSSLGVSPAGVSLAASSTLPRKFSFNCSREKLEYGKPNIQAGSSRRNPERSYSLYNEDALPSYRKSSVEDRNNFESIGNASNYRGDLKSPSDQYGSPGSCYEPLRKYRISPSPDSMNCHRKYQSTDYGLENDIGCYRSPVSPSFYNEPSLESYSCRNTLPRKYGSVGSCPETKSADYYEELLTPSRSDYLTARKTPTANDLQTRKENGYHNGSLETRHTDNDKWTTYSEKIAELRLGDGSDGQLDKQTRSNAEKDNESQDLPASSTEPDGKPSKAEFKKTDA